MLTSVSLVMTVLTVGGWTGRIVYTIHYIIHHTMLYKVWSWSEPVCVQAEYQEGRD